MSPLLKLAPLLGVLHCTSKTAPNSASLPPQGPSDTGSDSADDTGSGTDLSGLTLSPHAACTHDDASLRRWSDETWQSQHVDERAVFPPTAAWGVAVADFDGDGSVDIFLPQLGVSEFFFGNGEAGFTRRAEVSYPWPSGFGLAATPVDIEGDGDFDIVETGFGHLRLLINDGAGVFSAGTMPSVDPTTIYFGSAWADMDGDGDLDGIVAAFPTPLPSIEERETADFIPGAPDILLENTDAGLIDRRDLLPDTNNGHTFLSAWQDMDGDHNPEIIVMNDHLSAGQTNRVWRLQGERFEDISEPLALDAAMESMGLGIADLNGDRHPDFLVSGWGELGLFESDPSGEVWTRTAAARGLAPSNGDQSWVGWAVEFVDLDHDGHEEGLVAYGHWEFFNPEDNPDTPNPDQQPDALFVFGDGEARDESAAWGFAEDTPGRAMTVADLNSDGHMEVVRRPVYSHATIDSPPCSEAGSITLSLQQPGPNPHGIGATVRIMAGEKSQTRWVRAGGTGLASGGPPVVHFGLDGAPNIDTLSVTWPDGTESSWQTIPANHHIQATRD